MDNRYRDQNRQGNYGRQQEQFSGSQGQYSGGDRYSEQSGGYGNTSSRERHDNYGSFGNTQYGAGDRYEQGGSQGGYNQQNDYTRQSQFGQSSYGGQSGGSYEGGSYGGGSYGGDRYEGGTYGGGSYGGGSRYGNTSHTSFRGDDYGGRNMGGGMDGRMGGQSYGGGDYSRGSYSGSGGYTGGGMSGGQDYYGGSSYGSGQSGYGSSQGYSGGRNYSRGGDRDDNRGFFDRMSDKIGSWFGDDDRGQNRQDGMRSYGAGYYAGSSGQSHRGRGPGNYKRSDERVLEDVCDRLTDDHSIDASGIEVTVQDGEVTLNGTVNSRMDKRRAEDIVDDMSGVKHVQNNLRVQDSGSSYGSGSSGSSSGYGSGSTGMGGMSGSGSTGSTSGSGGTMSNAGGVKETADVKRDPDATNKATGSGSTSKV